MIYLMAAAVAAAVQALLLCLVNMRRYARPAPAGAAEPTERISVCIPARNEEANIEACVRSALASGGAEVEVLVYDDQSTDRTPEILAALRREDDRVRVPATLPLPAGWNGKQHGCHRLAEAASGAWLLFTDADVRFEPECLARTLAQARRSDVALLSTVPRQIIHSLGDGLLVPLIHFLLLSYLPIGRMRSTLDPAASAGCGQFLFVRADAYRASGGHAAFRASMHDGIRMPRALRAAGFRTDLFDGTDVVSCRMYRGFLAAWRGFAKNAFEGLGSVGLLLFVTVLHLLGHVLPPIVLVLSLLGVRPLDAAALLAAVATAVALVQRLLLARRFRQPVASALLHPLGVLLMTAVQWYSLVLATTGRRSWKGRTGTSPAVGSA